VAFAASLLIAAETIAVDVRRGFVGCGAAARLALIIGTVQHARAVLTADIPTFFRQFVVALLEDLK
jgi:hypothetical protein